jgi:hypothetical protein
MMTDTQEEKALAWDLLRAELIKAQKTIFHSKNVGEVDWAMAWAMKEAKHKLKESKDEKQ